MRGWREFRGVALLRAPVRLASGVAIGLAALLACLALLGAVAADRGASGWTAGVVRELTIVVRPRVDETGPTAAARAAEAAAGVDGVTEVRALDRAQAEDLLRPWVREGDLADLPLPMLVVAKLDPETPAGALTVNRALAEAGLDAEVDDAGPWRAEAARAAAGVRALALALSLAALGALGALAWARAASAVVGMSAEVAVLQGLGAGPGRLRGLTLAAVLPFVAAAAAAGAAGGVVLGAAWKLLAGGGQAASTLPLAWGDLLLAPATVAVAVLAAALSSARVLREVLGGPSAHG
ncbi:MAG TPA: ABC transporter permease [Brevundimonas sp.]|jgi:cell division transport system permease protein|uniref:ABC transporter permease n=1 Tax=Brevundimonas sp. TaxID=1871086 RepID=UPI002DE4DC95|nr:ABC transporter permease [Brevundimonas sp.]